MSIKSRNRGTDITSETRSQDAEELHQRHSMLQDQHTISFSSIQYKEVDETKTTRNIIFYFSLVFPVISFVPVKYPTR